MNAETIGLASNAVSRAEVEDFLYYEAELLDAWRLPEWLQLFTEDATYEVPTTNLPADASSDENLFYIADDRFRLGERVKRLMKRAAHAEFPHSKTRHIVANVSLRGRDVGRLDISCSFVTYRPKNSATHLFFGTLRYQLVQAEGQLRIRCKRVLLDTDGLRQQGRLSIIL
jgi:p-cumate 2,3-dioxygenase subunit beta